jgi:hypothetical protein
MKEAPGSSETSVLTRATRRNNPEDTILHSLHSYLKEKQCDVHSSKERGQWKFLANKVIDSGVAKISRNFPRSQLRNSNNIVI